MLQTNVAVERIHKSVIFGLDRSTTRRAAHLEVGNLHRTMRFHLRQGSMEIVVGRQQAVDALENPEVCVLELVCPGDWSLARIAGIPGTEMPARLDFSGRYGVQEHSVVVESVLATQ